jgi:uncharacterized protein HemX
MFLIALLSAASLAIGIYSAVVQHNEMEKHELEMERQRLHEERRHLEALMREANYAKAEKFTSQAIAEWEKKAQQARDKYGGISSALDRQIEHQFNEYSEVNNRKRLNEARTYVNSKIPSAQEQADFVRMTSEEAHAIRTQPVNAGGDNNV